MKCKSLVAMTFLAACAPAVASQQIAPVQVTGSPEMQLVFACTSPVRPSRSDVERILEIRDTTNTTRLGTQLMGAVGEACRAGVAHIEVRRGAQSKSLVWTAVPEQAMSVASN